MKTIDAIFSKARAEVLRNLFRDGDTELHLREIARRSGLTLHAIQKELASLTAAEIVVSRRDGNRQYFKANKANPIYPELRGIVQKDNAIADLIAEALQNAPGIEVAFIYGSVASHNEKAASDVDLFVIGAIGLRELVPLLRPVSEKIRREINPYNTTAESWRQKLSAHDAFINNVASGAKIFVKGNQDDLERLAK
jgi:DNA-binding transcriptional ArsR family regulator